MIINLPRKSLHEKLCGFFALSVNIPFASHTNLTYLIPCRKSGKGKLQLLHSKILVYMTCREDEKEYGDIRSQLGSSVSSAIYHNLKHYHPTLVIMHFLLYGSVSEGTSKEQVQPPTWQSTTGYFEGVLWRRWRRIMVVALRTQSLAKVELK